MSGAALGGVLKPPKPDKPALAGAKAPLPKEKGPGVVDAAGTGALLDAAAAVSVGVPLLGLVAAGLEAPVALALLGLELLSAGAPKLKALAGATAGTAAGTEGAAGAGAAAGPKLNSPNAGIDCCPDCVGPAAQTAKTHP